MSDIVISITGEQLIILLDVVQFIVLAASFFLLFWVKKRVNETFSKSFLYFIIGITIAIATQIAILLRDLSFLTNIIYERFFVFTALFFLLTIISFYKGIKTGTPRHRVHHRVHHRSVRRK